MQNNLKKIGIVGACLVAMVGTGGCLTTLAVSAVKDKIDQNKIKSTVIERYDTLKNKLATNQITSNELLEFAHLNNDYLISNTKKREMDYNFDKNYLTYLTQAVQTGNAQAKTEWLQLQFLSNVVNASENLPPPQITLSQTLNQLITMANTNSKQFCQIFPLKTIYGVNPKNFEPRTNLWRDEWLHTRILPTYAQDTNFQSVILASNLICYSATFNQDNIRALRNSLGTTVITNISTLDNSKTTQVVFYGALLELQPNNDLSKYLYGGFSDTIQADIQKQAHSLANYYRQTIHTPPKTQ